MHMTFAIIITLPYIWYHKVWVINSSSDYIISKDNMLSPQVDVSAVLIHCPGRMIKRKWSSAWVELSGTSLYYKVQRYENTWDAVQRPAWQTRRWRRVGKTVVKEASLKGWCIIHALKPTAHWFNGNTILIFGSHKTKGLISKRMSLCDWITFWMTGKDSTCHSM